MKSKEIVLDGIGGQIQVADLIPDVEAGGRVIDLRDSQTGLLQQRKGVAPCRLHLRMGEPCNGPAGAGKRSETLLPRIIHRGNSPLLGRIDLLGPPCPPGPANASKPPARRRASRKIYQVFGTL